MGQAAVGGPPHIAATAALVGVGRLLISAAAA